MATHFLQLFFQHLATINMLSITYEHHVISLIAQYHGFNDTYFNQHMLGSMTRNCCQINAKSNRDDETNSYQVVTLITGIRDLINLENNKILIEITTNTIKSNCCTYFMSILCIGFNCIVNNNILIYYVLLYSLEYIVIKLCSTLSNKIIDANNIK